MAQEPSPKSASSGNSQPQAPLPFQPKSKKSQKKIPKVSVAPLTASKPESQPSSPKKKAGLGIPEVVSNRMATRMAVCCGIPSLLGLLTFPLCYVIVKQELFELPNVAVVLVSMGFFGLGVVGLSYGVISASWEEELSGSFLGWSEFRLNLGRIIESWQTRKQNS
ncbi:PAM68 family protein [Thermosynechococcaceae cyanobacterium BACA0444]|uniref:PAM68 family protein n=1 Tax=Pseudocalidococcus azoricus BACA0444 TaxID=2918990 RepID=A0AAE4FRA0_9CYAN|nr:PAM68 family protein [Pseudocalidococcus azoricus]MDS3860229.1 PAM68 family protein [Pseudocalidococcus azoricus BACA0444]